MTDQSPTRPHLSEVHEPDLESYRALCGLAVVGLVLGLLSPIALVDPVLWCVPFAALLVCGLALWRIARRSPDLFGRKAALTGLFLALIFLGVSVGHWATTRWLLDHQARAVAEKWFALVSENKPMLAHQLRLAPDVRQPPESDVAAAYRASPELRKQLEKFTATDLPLISLLTTPGEKATVRYQSTEHIGKESQEEGELVVLLYTVTSEAKGEKTPRYVRLVLKHSPGKIAGRGEWQITHVDPDAKPAGEEDEEGIR